MPDELQGRTVALLIAPQGTEEPEFSEPKKAVEGAGATVHVISAETGEVKTVNNDLEPGGSYTADKAFSEVSADDYDALIIPGGTVGADKLRGNPEAVRFIRSFFEQGKPVGAICHGPWTLVEAGVVEGRKLTSYPTLANRPPQRRSAVARRRGRDRSGVSHEPKSGRSACVLRQTG